MWQRHKFLTFLAALLFTAGALAQVPIYTKPQGSSSISGGSAPGGTNNSVPFINPAGSWNQDNPNFTYTIGTTTLAAPTITATTKISNAAGNASGPTWIFGTDSSGWYRVDASRWAYGGGGGGVLAIGSNLLILNSATSLGWVSGSDPSAAGDVFLTRDAANTLAQRNGTNAQAFRVYNTYTDASNYERISINWSGNVARFMAEAAGTGSNRGGQFNFASYSFQSNGGTQWWNISSSDHLNPGADNSFDIGIVTTNRVRDLYLNGSAGGNATAGAVGEYLSATAAANAVALTTNTTATVTSQSLTAGDWDCTGVVNYTFAASTSFTNLVGGTSSTTATLGTQDTTFDFETPAAVPTATKVMSWVVPMNRFSLSSTTTVYLVTQATFTVSTLGAGGTLRCRRMR